MFLFIQVVSVFLVAVAMALALAHALELPGKMRLDKETYAAVQPIYYPGFTIGGGLGEGLGTLLTLVLFVMTPAGNTAFWWTLAALLALVVMHAAYWTVTHPVNKFWLKDQQLGRLGTGFFSSDPARRDAPSERDWQSLRNRWEYSHVLRAVLAAFALLSLIVAVALY